MCEKKGFMVITLWGITLFLQTLHLAYHQITTIFDFYPFNNIRSYTKKQQIIECVSCGVTMGFPIIATFYGGKIMVGISVGLFVLLLIGEYLSWWRHYFFGPAEYWKEVYNRKFKSTIIVLPAIKDHPIPNLEHLILHVITVVTFVVTVLYFLSI